MPPSVSNHEAEPGVGLAGEVKDDEDEAVDADLRHHAREQRRDVARRRRMGERQPDVQRDQAGLRAGAEKHQHHGERRREGGMGSEPHGREGVAAVRSREEAEGEQQAEGAETRHHKIDIGGAARGRVAVIGEHDRPRRQGHELPRQQEREGVVGEDDQIHAGEKGGIERQHPGGCALVAAVAQRIETGDRGAQVDDHQEERAQRIDAEPGADARQADRQCQRPRPGVAKPEHEKAGQRGAERHQRQRQRAAVNDGSRSLAVSDEAGEAGETEIAQNAPQPGGRRQVDPGHDVDPGHS